MGGSFIAASIPEGGGVAVSAAAGVLQTRPFTTVEPGGWRTRIPLLVVFGEADNWTLFEPCRDFIAAAQRRGHPVDMVSYPGALHGFDAPNQPRRELSNYAENGRPAPIVGTNDRARADALLRTLAFLREKLVTAP